jgi:hypothetical protein
MLRCPSATAASWALACLAMVLTVCLPATPTVGAAVPHTQLVVGTAKVQGNNLNAAKEEAIAECKLAAVEAALAELLPLAVMVERLPDLNAIVYDRAGDFVQDYRVLNDVRSGGSYRVLVQATVAVALLTDRLRTAGLLSAEATAANAIQITVQGTDNLANATLFRSSLNDIEGVEGVQTRDVMADQMVLVVSFRGPSERFVEALLLRKHSGFTTRVYTASPDNLRVELVPAP